MALSVLLPRVGAQGRAVLFKGALDRFHGSLPSWFREILIADMLFALSTEARADLLLAVDTDQLAAWVSLLDAADRARLLQGLPDSLRALVGASTPGGSQARRIALAARGRREIAAGLQRQLTRAGLSFEQVLQPSAPSES